MFEGKTQTHWYFVPCENKMGCSVHIFLNPDLLETFSCVGKHRLKHNRILIGILWKFWLSNMNNYRNGFSEIFCLIPQRWGSHPHCIAGCWYRATWSPKNQNYRTNISSGSRSSVCLHPKTCKVTFCKADMSSYFSSSILCWIFAMSTGLLIIWGGGVLACHTRDLMNTTWEW